MRPTAALLFASAALAAAAPAQAVPDDAMYAKPGQLFQASDGARLNFYCTGSGSPAVVFDSGFLDWAPAWSVVQPRIASFTRVCSYDRAGAGFSAPAVMPVTIDRIASELDSALKASGIGGPYILVGAASGGTHIRAFADLFPQDVAGLVLLDADANDVDLPENRADGDKGILGFVPVAGGCRDRIAAGNAAATLPPVPGRPPKRCATIFFRGLPETSWSPELNAKLIDIGGHNVAMWDADISEAENIPAGEIWLQQHRRNLGNTPIRVLSTGHHGIHDLTKPPPMSLGQLKYQYDKALAQSRWLTLSSDATQVFVQNSSEYIGFEQPDAVVDAVREIYDKAKRSR
jgi:pimeloyl-ACP methyl ester carboxylesterase